MNGNRIALLCSLFMAIGTGIGWSVSVGTRLGSFATVEQLDKIAGAQIAVDRETLNHFATIGASIARLDAQRAADLGANDREHQTIREDVRSMRNENPRIEGRRQ